tara:strand:- start:478 stop:1632 length:1155 start_codon:yes stop_codon:yes gene_type:complete
MYADGAGLYLNITGGGTKSWILRVTIKGKKTSSGTPLRKEIGLGGVDTVSLSEARKMADSLRGEAKAGRDPTAKRDHREKTFEDVTRLLHTSLAPTFRSEKHKAQWLSGLAQHAFPLIGDINVADVKREDALAVLNPIWVDMHPTAKRLRQRMEAVFNHAIGKGFRGAPNPIDGALRDALPKAKHKPKHHAALSWREVPDFMVDLEEREAIAAACLRFIILTAARSGEARMATWQEIDLKNQTWTIPASRMKAEEEHRVPLSDDVVAILEHVRGLDPEYVFPSPQGTARGLGKPLSVNAFRPLFQRMKREGMTAHGFRSSFRDWCAEKAHADRQLAEAALAHRVGGVEGAYFRSDLFERRRALMDAWSRYATGQSGDVVELVRA